MADHQSAKTNPERADVATPEAGTTAASGRREVDEVMSMLAHEVRGHLNEIVLVQGLLLADARLGTLTADQQARLRQVGRAAGRVATLLDTLTDLGRRDGGRRPVEPLAIAALAADVMTELSAEPAVASRISLEVEPNLPALRGDAAVVRAVLRTLLQTVIRYASAPQSPVVLRIAPLDSGIAMDLGPGSFGATPHAGVRLALYVVSRLIEAGGGTAALGADGSLRVTLPDDPQAVQPPSG